MTPLVEQVEKDVTGLLRQNLPDAAVYHSLEHTQFVTQQAEKIARHSGLGEEEVEIVVLAAWFHDVGYLKGPKGHETASIEYAREYLEKEGYPEDHLNRVLSCIQATEMPQNPKNMLDQVLCDADLSHLGTPGFFQKSETLLDEMQRMCQQNWDAKEWMEATKDFLENHNYFTPYAKKTFGKLKEQNLKEIQRRIAKYPLPQSK